MERNLRTSRVRWIVAALSFTHALAAFAGPDPAPVPCRDWKVDRHPRLMADVNNDGKADIVGFGDAGVWTALSNGDGTFAAANLVLVELGTNQGWDPSKHVRVAADLNNDGMADVVGFGDAGVWTALATGGGGLGPAKFVLADFGANQGWSPSKHVRLMADINHDGKADIVAFGDAGVWTALAKGDGSFLPQKFVIANFGLNQGWDPSKHVRLMADINHDGRADIVAFGNDGVWTALAKGDGGFLPEKFVLANFGANQGWSPAKHVRLMADINHDGRADIVAFGDAGVWTALAKGDGGFLPEKFVLANFGATQGWEPSKHVRTLADVNNDARADIVAFGDDGVWTALAKGDGGFLPEKFVLADFGVNQAWDPSKHVRLMADISKDGKADIVGFGNAGVLTALAIRDGGFAPVHLVMTEIFTCNGRLDFNLEWGELAPGGFPLNPRWRWQRDNPGVPNAELCHFFSKTVIVGGTPGGGIPVRVPDFADCTDQTDMSRVDTPDGWNGFICGFESTDGFHGHLNWFAATYTGGLGFGDHNYDDDYYMSLRTEGDPALINDRHAMHTEFNAGETIDNFGTPWWTGFRNIVDASETAAIQLSLCNSNPSIPCTQAVRDALKAAIRRPKEMLRGSDGAPVEAIMTGLFGVDLEHGGGKSELHPVYALAAHVKDDPADDVWAIFVRNRGNEGYCSRKIWKEPFTSYTFRLKWRPGMDSVKAVFGNSKSVFEGTAGTAGPAIVFTPGQGIDVTFTLPPPSEDPLIDGELHLEWRGQLQAPAKPKAVAGEDRFEEHDEAGILREAVNRLPEEKRRRVERARPAGEKALTLRRLPAVAEARQVPALPTVAPVPAPSDLATRKSARDAARLHALCEAWNGSPPGLPPDICAQESPKGSEGQRNNPASKD